MPHNLVLGGKLLVASDSLVIFVNTTNQMQLNDILMGTVWLLGFLQAFFLLHSNESLMLTICSRAALIANAENISELLLGFCNFTYFNMLAKYICLELYFSIALIL